MKPILILFAISLSAASSPAAIPDFSKDIAPVLKAKCLSCHGGEKRKGGLDMRTLESIVAGGDNGAAVVPGNKEKSMLWTQIRDGDMPPEGKPQLTPAEKDLIANWLSQGAFPSATNAAKADLSARGASSLDGEMRKAGRGHWAFQAPVRPAVPAVKATLRVRTPVDGFILARLEEKGLGLNAEADRRTLIRRVTLDLTGLPPAPKEVEAFVGDDDPKAYENLVERLLKSPHYGERWGRHWLDLARWTETDGMEGNAFRSSVWLYRDYVVRSFNDDKPYDAFLRQQIAGDELEPYADDNIIATGFLAGARYSNNEEDKAMQRNDILVDIANTAAAVTTGLSMNCAQCHTHKFDPLSIQDYYRWHGFFVRGQLLHVRLKDAPPTPAMASEKEAILAKIAAAKKLDADYLALGRSRLDPAALAKLEADKSQKGHDALAEAIGLALGPADRGKRFKAQQDARLLANDLENLARHMWAFYSPATSPHKLETFKPRGGYPLPYQPDELKKTLPVVLRRGDPHVPGEVVNPGWPEVLGGHPAENLGEKPRTKLTEWLASARNPLTARVMVNFIWQQHFGRALVDPGKGFGLLGDKPTHPALLDWLAVEFRERAWSIKHLHRLIVLSATYRASSAPEAKNLAADPDNLLRWRWVPRRLEAEALRDAALDVAGEIDLTLGGPSVPPADIKNSTRRSLYQRQTRDDFPEFQAVFDFPRSHDCSFQRLVSTVPLQALYLMNGEFLLKRAEALARRALAVGPDFEAQTTAAFTWALGRPPSDSERAAAHTFRAAHPSPDARRQPDAPPAALLDFCHALLNANEFTYLN